MSALFSMIENVYRLNVAQLRWVMFNVRAAAVHAGHLHAVAVIDAATVRVEDAGRAHQEYTIANARRADSRDAQNLDRQIDRTVSILHSVIDAFAGMGRETPVGREASDLLAEAFPYGLAGHVNASHTEQASHNLNLVQRLSSPTNLPFVTRNGLEPLLVELSANSLKFRTLIGADTTITFDEVRAALTLAEEAVLLAVMNIASSFRPHVKHETDTRDAILRPYREMMSKVGAEKRAVLAEAKRDKAAAQAEAQAEAAEAGETDANAGDQDGTERTDTTGEPDAAPDSDAAPAPAEPAATPVAGPAAVPQGQDTTNARADESLAAK